MSVNGSSATGNCFNVTIRTVQFGSLSRCNAPTSSVLFDGNIPTLTGLDGNMWASQLFTLETSNGIRRAMWLEVTDFVTRVEIVMFNCPEWGISTQIIRLTSAESIYSTLSPKQFNIPTITSCDSLVRTCISQIIVQPVIYLEFISPHGSNWAHLAEVEFYSTGTCPSDAVIPSLPLSDATTDGTTVAISNNSLSSKLN